MIKKEQQKGAKIGQYSNEELEPKTKTGGNLVLGDDTLNDEEFEEKMEDLFDELLDPDYLDLT